MLANEKYKILLIQLPAPEYNFQKQWGNVPLAAGYLKAVAHKEGLLNEVDVEILGKKDTDLSADARLVDLIISKSPDILGFSLYVWNSLRSMFIAEKVKKKLPKTKIMVGGPELSSETKYLLGNPVIDFGCFGEGEFAFTEMLKNIINGRKDHSNIKGIFYRKSRTVVITAVREPLKDLNQIPSPFILGFINPKHYHTITYEAMRGCLFKCSYCVTGLTPMRYFSADRICEDMKVILKSGAKYVRFADSDFTLHPFFYEICEKIKEVNKEKKLSFSMFMYAGHIDKRRVDILKESNVQMLEIGLQSINQTTLGNIQRPPLDKTKFLTGLRLLKQRNIFYRLDIIIGLPSETIRDLKETLKFLIDNKISMEHLWSFVLALLPGTRLRKEAKRYGIKYQNEPPYLLIETDYISKTEIEEAKRLFQVKRRPNFEGALISYCNPRYPRLQEKTALVNFFRVKRLNNVVNKVIIELDRSCQTSSQLKALGKKLSRMVGQPFTVWFKSKNAGADLSLIEALLLPIARANPFIICSIIIETDTVVSLWSAERVKKIMRTKEKIFSELTHTQDALTVCAIYPWEAKKRLIQRLRNYGKEIPFFWSLYISAMHDWRSDITNLFQEKSGSGMLIDFDQQSTADFIINGLKFFDKKSKIQPKTISIRNLAIKQLQSFIKQKDEGMNFSLLQRLWLYQSILSLDRNLNVLSLTKSADESTLDLIQCQMIFMRMLKNNRAKDP